ncbi:MAG: hypothetical protein HQK57_06925 [Deltaproteobacteria bacterium]|nr:hypothetical protein [Deltaproteobacteria bacterium]
MKKQRKMMATSPGDARQAQADEKKEQGWLDKRRTVLDRLRRDKKPAHHNQAEIQAEKQRLRAEVDKLEGENHSLTRRVKDLDTQLFELKQQAQLSYTRSDELKNKLTEVLALERGLADEIRFFESEKAALSQEYLVISNQVGANMVVLDQTAKDIDFLNGEVEATITKMDMTKDEVMDIYSDVDHLDEKITGMIASLKELSRRMQRMEKNIKIVYYQMKKNV